MKGVTIDGVEYLPATSLAKQFRYTTDYIGQLCRAKKVDAKLVGRTWYVNPLSLTKHKTARYKKVEPAEKTTEIAKEITLSRTEVNPEIFVSKHQKLQPTQQPHFSRRIDWKPLKYEADEVELLPKMTRPDAIPHKIKLNLAEATSISVKNSSKDEKMVADELPAVSLRGKLTIESLNDSFAETAETAVPETPLSEANNIAENIVSLLNIPPSAPKRYIHYPAKLNSSVSLIPTRQTRAKTTTATVPVVEAKSGRGLEVLLLTSTTVLAGCLFLLLFGELNLNARPGSYEWEFIFSTQSLPALVSLFSQ
ncbi:MAG TPA: hypothetical protein PKA42_01085 [Candidatus Paceibacterota bacterium]|nr:hypothetical protein [Candidatus Paceibacterota bacterium]HMO82737.1 hypothetical protein [Candidatus Paceibacterota bacterium]